MKHLALIALMLLPALPAAADDGFNAGASFGKSNSSAGTGSLKNPGAVTGAIPGYTANPPEKGYYNGVTGGDGGLAGKGQAALQGSDAGQAILDSGTKNPPTSIDPNAPFITIGKDAENSAGGILDGSASQCTATTVGRTVFENFSCDRDAYVMQSCTRSATMTGHWETATTTTTVSIDSADLPLKYPGILTYTGAPSGTIKQVDMSYTFDTRWAFDNPGNKLNITLFGVKMDMYNSSGSYSFLPMKNVSEGENLEFIINSANGKAGEGYIGWRHNFEGSKTLVYHFTVVLTYETTTRVWVPEVAWSESCSFNKGQSAGQTDSQCSVAGGNQSQVVDGQTYTVYSPCWQYTDYYAVQTNSEGNCSSLLHNAACTLATRTCTQQTGAFCEHESLTFQCQKTYQSDGLLCGGEYICKSGNCDETNGAGNSGFDTAVAKLAGLASAADDVAREQDQLNVKAFTGKAMSCRKAFAGFSNCCKDSGWGQDAGLSACNSEEMALGKAKAKKITVSIGERCDHQVLGVCVQKSQVYCVFDGKLARIIQEQGRRDQLGVRFGSGDSPNCRGISIPELQSINFDLINFADFYEDLMNNQRIPDTSAQVQQIKDRIATQVNQQGGGK